MHSYSTHPSIHLIPPLLYFLTKCFVAYLRRKLSGQTLTGQNECVLILYSTHPSTHLIPPLSICIPYSNDDSAIDSVSLPIFSRNTELEVELSNSSRPPPSVLTSQQEY